MASLIGCRSSAGELHLPGQEIRSHKSEKAELWRMRSITGNGQRQTKVASGRCAGR